MNKYFTDIFKRMNIRQINSFILYGSEYLEEDTRSYEEQIEEEDKPMMKRLEDLFSNEEERNEILIDINRALYVREQLYMEIGMKAGARIMFQLLSKQNEST